MHSHTFHLICLLFPSFTSFRFLTCRFLTCRWRRHRPAFLFPHHLSDHSSLHLQLSLWGLSRWAAVCSSTYLSSSYPFSKLIKKCLRSPLTSFCPPTADLLKLVNWSPFILIIVWIFHVCDLWIKHRIQADMIGLTFIHTDWFDLIRAAEVNRSVLSAHLHRWGRRVLRSLFASNPQRSHK